MTIGRSATVIPAAMRVGFGPLAVWADDGGGGREAGDTLGADDWQRARDLLPPEMLEHHETGRHRNRIVCQPGGWRMPGFGERIAMDQGRGTGTRVASWKERERTRSRGC